jgi:hypothetical protein
VKDRNDRKRVHFVGTIPYASFVNLMCATRVARLSLSFGAVMVDAGGHERARW